MLINNLQVYSDELNFLSIAQLIGCDGDTRFSCDISIMNDRMYITSYDYDINIVRRDELYVVNVFDNIDRTKRQYVSCDKLYTAKIIQNLNAFKKFYRYSNLYEYLLEDTNYMVTLSLSGSDYIDLHIMDGYTFKIAATMEIRRTTDGFFKYRYFGSFTEKPVGSPSKLIREFIKGWA